MEPKKQSSTFHTDQNKWEYRDFENEEFDRIINDNNERPEEEFFEAMDVREDSYHANRIHYQGDEEIENVIKELLHNSDRVDSSDITVQVTDRKVHLSGTVKTQKDRDYIKSVVELVHGVGPVESDIIVKLNEGILPTDIGRSSTL
jgi:hypothetical protein